MAKESDDSPELSTPGVLEGVSWVVANLESMASTSRLGGSCGSALDLSIVETFSF